MVSLIVAYDKNKGIGKNGKMPWYCKEELQLFKQKTLNSTIIVGRKTAENLPTLSQREVLIVSNTLSNNINIFRTIESAISFTQTTGKQCFIAGGRQVYKYALDNKLVKTIHLSIMKDSYDCDTFFNLDLSNFIVTSYYDYAQFEHYILEYNENKHDEYQYLNLLSDILKNGEYRNTRNGNTLSLFGKNLSFDLRNGFPLLTTKKMFIRGIIEELLFFIRGETDSTLLEEKGVNIWKGNTSAEFINNLGLQYSKGVMGPMYGYQWRFYGKEYKIDENGKPDKNNNTNSKYIDQLQEVINLIKTDPTSRRILLTDFNPLQAKEGVLYPCHSIIIQFYVNNEYLDMFCYNRSQDTFLGTPFNIASSALLLIIIASITKLKPRYLKMGLGDVHIYENHINAVKTQIDRFPFVFPLITIPEINSLEDVEKLNASDFEIVGYKSHSTIKAEMVA